jgi:desulfoferrodoxin (superoxide reductase-like protein)
LDPKYSYAIKYFNLQNNASNQNKFAKDVSQQTDAHWEKHLGVIGLPLEKSHPGVRIDAGVYHGMPMAIHAYVLGPLLASDLEGLVQQ